MALDEKDQCLRERLNAKAEKDGQEEHEAQTVSHLEKVKFYKNVIKECLELGKTDCRFVNCRSHHSGSNL